ncbi:hypothetical protein NLG97_g9374 [Lecanicillium saksenae]|uniref:Uncharacterized protein n=1 Tax=Lecanicillium saksenae TaxID=468837 RepID=A0ACC1QG78_9HYPO|nr:hypothetical protein NLG97_g9374 [Lecanicillium saksenae]
MASGTSGDRGPQLTGVIATLCATSVITGLLRFYTHGVLIKRFFAEDYLTLIALILLCVYSTFGLLSVSYGLGNHTENVAPESRPKAIMYRWLGSLVYIVVSLLTKWIVGLFLLRICPRQRWRQITIWSIMIIFSLFSIIYFFLDIWSCSPVRYMWTRYNPEPAQGECRATTFATVTTYIAAVFNIIADFVLPALPATLVWQAQMERRVKISVIALLCLASTKLQSASIATVVRIPYARGILDNPDYLHTSTDICIWSTVEIGVALTASSLATLKPLLRKMRLFEVSEVMHYGSRSRTRSTGTQPTHTTSAKRASHVKTFSQGNHQITVTSTITTSAQSRDVWTRQKNKKRRESIDEVELVSKANTSSRSSQDKASWLEV